MCEPIIPLPGPNKAVVATRHFTYELCNKSKNVPAHVQTDHKTLHAKIKLSLTLPFRRIR